MRAEMQKMPAPLLKAVTGILGTACAVALVISMIPTQAFAYYNFGTVQIYPGTYALSVQAGQSTSTSLTLDPVSDMQTPGCMMAKCPQVCDSPEAYEAGYNCFDANGNCTCAGSQYQPYSTETSVSSSNSAVATATVSGGTLTVTGHSAGSATITVNASLRQWTSNSTSIQVEVTEAPSSSDSSSNSSGTSEEGSLASNPVVNLPAEAEVSESRDDALNETVVETVAGNVYMVEINGFLDTKTELEKIVGTGDQMVFWSGISSDKPNYSWTFYGEDVSADSPYLSFDPAIDVSKMGEEYVANLMDQAKDGVVLSCSYEGTLPATAALYVNVNNTYTDGTKLSLFVYNAEKRVFELVEEGLEVQAGYAYFKTDTCTLWALSTDDLTKYSVAETYTPLAAQSQDTSIMQETTNWVEIIAVIAAFALFIAAIVVILHRRKNLIADASVLKEQEEAANLQERVAGQQTKAAAQQAASSQEKAEITQTENPQE